MGTYIVPVFGHAPESGTELGLAAFKNFTRNDNIGYRPSYVFVKTTYTTKKALNLIGYSEIWAKNNTVYLAVDVRQIHYPFYFYGIGNKTKLANAILLDSRLAHIKLEGLKMVLPHYYIGANFLLEKQSFQTKNTYAFHHGNIAFREKKGEYLNIGLSQLYDNRDNAQYTTKGLSVYMNMSVLPRIKFFEESSALQFSFNGKYFYTPVKPLTIGYNLVYRSINGHGLPFYLLPQFGNDEIMRGYYQGRFRDKKLVAHQVEIKYHFIPRLAVTTFLGMGETTAKKWTFDMMRTSVGGGLRYFFDIKQQSTIRVDYAVTQRLAGEKRQTGLYILLGEAF